MAGSGSKACWFGLGVLLGAAAGGALAWSARAAPGRREPRQADAPLLPADVTADQVLTDAATDVVEYRGFVIHVFCHALGMGRFKALCDIWESGAVVLEGGAPPTTHATPDEARSAAIAWAQQWVQRNG
ncbi:hypothetical protein [Cupriavidus neocaledonicus]|uniref:Lipoprotein n=1 Tax=Cupriavidus neocaledonicus TaxID=1040979 RepID=A0A375H3L0_9BURK|nr:hypothetical protein [Cupriavidus neocaledonicus]SOZ37689.1 putative lipoprotein [Cupriavidus neocaledonicus]SPD46262.1 conserved protein of unknown function [Cupriavidus neocaledonicus]